MEKPDPKLVKKLEEVLDGVKKDTFVGVIVIAEETRPKEVQTWTWKVKTGIDCMVCAYRSMKQHVYNFIEGPPQMNKKRLKIPRSKAETTCNRNEVMFR